MGSALSVLLRGVAPESPRSAVPVPVATIGTQRSSCRRRSPCGGRSPWKPKKLRCA